MCVSVEPCLCGSRGEGGGGGRRGRQRRTVDDEVSRQLRRGHDQSRCNHPLSELRLAEHVQDCDIPVSSVVACDLLGHLVKFFASKLPGWIVGVCVEFRDDFPCFLGLSVAKHCTVVGKLGSSIDVFFSLWTYTNVGIQECRG